MLAILFFHFILQSTDSAEVFPYTTRTRSYSGWNSTIQGDVTSLGMGGATVAIPSSISAAQINPAGFAMVTASISAQILSNSIDDQHVQKNANNYNTNQWGLSVNPPPWGFGILYYSPTAESGSYQSPTTGRNFDTTVSVRELRIAVAHAFFENTLSLGLSLGVAKGIRELGSYAYNSVDLDFEIGALYLLPGHFILGASFIPQNTINPSGDADGQVDMPGFNQAIIAPTQTTLGIAWQPNRFFQTGFSLTYISSTTNTALLADQSKTVGATSVFEPRLGANYVFAEYRNFKLEYALGTYFEPSRISGEPNRMHATTGLEIEPWFMNVGFGFDLAEKYQNVLIAVNVDIVRAARVLDLIPKNPVPPYHGFFPPPFILSADGLPQGMTRGEHTNAPPASLGDVQKIITDVPGRIKEKFDSVTDQAPTKKKKQKKKKIEEESDDQD